MGLDCGTTATTEIAALRQQGVDVIVLDHHQVSTPPPGGQAPPGAGGEGPGKGKPDEGTVEGEFREV